MIYFYTLLPPKFPTNRSLCALRQNQQINRFYLPVFIVHCCVCFQCIIKFILNDNKFCEFCSLSKFPEQVVKSHIHKCNDMFVSVKNLLYNNTLNPCSSMVKICLGVQCQPTDFGQYSQTIRMQQSNRIYICCCCMEVLIPIMQVIKVKICSKSPQSMELFNEYLQMS